MSLNVKKGDTVLILTGKDKGEKGKVIQALPKTGKVRVENKNLVSKHKKARSAQDTGGIIKMEGAIDVSNVQIICPACGRNTRVAHAMDAKGKMARHCKKCGASLDAKAEKPKKQSKKKDEAKTEKESTKKTVAKEAKADKDSKKQAKAPAKKESKAKATEVPATETAEANVVEISPEDIQEVTAQGDGKE